MQLVYEKGGDVCIVDLSKIWFIKVGKAKIELVSYYREVIYLNKELDEAEMYAIVILLTENKDKSVTLTLDELIKQAKRIVESVKKRKKKRKKRSKKR